MVDGAELPSDKILVTLEELSKWTERRDLLREEVKRAPSELRELKKKELEMAKRHVKYYTALAKDMKKATRPPKLGQFFNSLSLL